MVGILLSAWYMLTMLQKVFFNPLKEPEPVGDAPTDVTRREFFAFGTLAGLCLLLGLFPQPVLDTMKWDVEQLSTIGRMARARVTGVPIPPRPGARGAADPTDHWRTKRRRAQGPLPRRVAGRAKHKIGEDD